MKEILLINPSIHPQRTEPDMTDQRMDTQAIPQGVIAIAAYCEKEGYPVTVIDTRLYSAEEARQAVLKKLPEVSVVGLSVMSAMVREAVDLTDLVKAFNKNIVTVWGGVHPSLFPEQTTRDVNVNFVVVGEGELPFSRLLAQLEASKDSFEEINNLAFKKDGGIFLRRVYEFIEPDSLPVMAYHLLDIERYVRKPFFTGSVVRSVEYHTSRGCPHSCAFCINTIISKRRWRAQSPEKVARDLSHLIERYKVQHITFLDEDFFPNIKRAIQIAAFLKTAGVTWDANCTLSYFAPRLMDDATLALLKESGAIMLRAGMESGSARVRKLISKRIGSNEDILKAVARCKQHGIQMLLAYMIALPTETKQEAIETLKLISRVQDTMPEVYHGGPQIFRPYPGGELYELCLQQGFPQPETLREWYRGNPADYVPYNDYTWIKDKAFVLDAVYAMTLIDKQNSRINPPRLQENPLKAWLRLLLKRWIQFRYEHRFWAFFYELRVLRLLSRKKLSTIG